MATEKRLIDATKVEYALMAIKDRESGIPEILAEWLAGVVCNAPTVDAVEVVRCKDCVYCSTKRGNRHNQLLRFCEWGDGHEKVQSDGKFFCAHGKRSEYAVD